MDKTPDHPGQQPDKTTIKDSSYKHSFPYPDGSKKRGRRSYAEQDEYNKTQQLKYKKGSFLITFD